MFHKINAVQAESNFLLKIHFVEGVSKIYDVKPWFEKFPVFLELKNKPDLFSKVSVGPGGLGVVWNDHLDISCDDLFFDGKII